MVVVSTLEYEVMYSNLDVEKLVKEKKSFELETVIAYIKEYKKGFKVKAISKTHKTGTKFTYIKIKNDDELSEYETYLTEMIREYNNKYNDKIAIDEIN